MLLDLRILWKWRRDRRSLPLTEEHWDLYRILHRDSWRRAHRLPDLVHGRGFNDRIQWLKLFDQDERMVQLSDKAGVRAHVEERVGPGHLTRLHQLAANFDGIDWDALPSSFVVKATNDSGSVVLVPDRSHFDREAAREKVEHGLQREFGWKKGEWAYSGIEPRVLVEEYLEPDATIVPPDFKFHCVEGRVAFCHFIHGRHGDVREVVTDPQGRVTPHTLYFPGGAPFVRPPEWDRMVEVAEAVARGFRYVRVDLFLHRGRVLVGEMTFWPNGGCYVEPGEQAVGEWMEFDRSHVKPPVYRRVRRRRNP